MRFVSLDALADNYWYSFNDEPIAAGTPLLFPRLSDPSFLLPDESPDALWHLFAASWRGVEHYTSTSGLEWKAEHLVFFRASSPSVCRDGSVYCLLFEEHEPSYRKKGERSDSSRIMLSTSSDLALWSSPRKILDSADIPLSSWRKGRRRLFRPQLIHWNGKYRLYFGAGEAGMYDTGRTAPAMLMYAEANYIEGPYAVHEEPVMRPDPESDYMSLAVGSVKVIPCSDGIAAVAAPRFYDKEGKRSSSLLELWRSTDGISFSGREVIHTSPERGWASGYLTSCDIRYKENEETWYCYYSADGCPDPRLPLRRESLGLLLGRKR